MTALHRVMALAAVLALAACQSARPTSLPHGSAAYQVVPQAQPSPTVARQLRPGDSIAVAVFREPDLGAEKLVLDELGNVQLPLLGEITAGGKTLAELSQTISQRLGARYLRRPQVTIALLDSVALSMSVEGQVKAPGVFPVGPNETLLTSLARAGSPAQTAKLDEIVVFRTVNGQRMGAVFDLQQIRTGTAPDPQILDGDTIVVGYSAVKGAFRDFLVASPLLNLFTVF